MATRGRRTRNAAASRKRRDTARAVTAGKTFPKSSGKWRWIAAAAAVAALLVAWQFLPLKDWLEAVASRISDMGVLGAILYCALYVLASLLFVPGSILTLAAGYLFGIAGGMAVVWVAAVATAAIAFLIARYVARDSVERLAKRNPKFGALDAAIDKNGWKVVGLLRLSAIVPFSLSNYFLGLTAVDFGPYVAATAAGTLPGTFFYVYLGAAGKSLGESGEMSTWAWVILGVGLIATAVTAVILTRLAKKHLKGRRVE